MYGIFYGCLITVFGLLNALCFLGFLWVLRSAGRDSPRRATSFLARARKDAKKACCAALRRGTRYAPPLAALRSDSHGELDGMLRWWFWWLRPDGCVFLEGRFACCAASAGAAKSLKREAVYADFYWVLDCFNSKNQSISSVIALFLRVFVMAKQMAHTTSAEAAQQAKPPLVTKAHPSGHSRPNWPQRFPSSSP